MGRKADPKIRERILDEAEHLIHLRGIRATCLDDIAEACGMTKANLFHHFGSKEELALAVLDAKMADYRKRRVEPLCAQGNPVSAVACMFTNACRSASSNGCRAGCFIANIALEMADTGEEFRKRASSFFKEWAASMAGCLRRAQKAGLFAATLDPRAAAESVVSLYEGAALLARTHRDASVFQRVGRVARSILEQHKNRNRRNPSMGPKTPCGC